MWARVRKSEVSSFKSLFLSTYTLSHTLLVFVSTVQPCKSSASKKVTRDTLMWKNMVILFCSSWPSDLASFLPILSILTYHPMQYVCVQYTYSTYRSRWIIFLLSALIWTWHCPQCGLRAQKRFARTEIKSHIFMHTMTICIYGTSVRICELINWLLNLHYAAVQCFMLYENTNNRVFYNHMFSMSNHPLHPTLLTKPRHFVRLVSQFAFLSFYF